jgi:hypothetical protein
MLRGEQAAVPAGQPDGDRYAGLAACHIAHLGRLIDDFVHGAGDEIEIHQLDHRPHAGHRGADSKADDARLGDRRFEDAAGKAFINALGHGVWAAVHDDVFADDEDLVIALHLLVQGLAQRIAETDRSHAWAPTFVANTSVSAASAVG